MKKIGIALGGGGAKGFAHIGIIKALRENKEFLPTIIAGTSVGSIVATLYASALSQDKLEESAREFNWFRDVIDLRDSAKLFINRKMGGLLSNSSLGETINELINGRNFNELEIDLAIVATEVEKRTRVIFTSDRVAENIDKSELLSFLPEEKESKPGLKTLLISDFNDVGKTVQASCAVPGIFQPVEIRGMKLFDGGIVDHVPVDVIRAMGADISIGVSLGLGTVRDKLKNPVYTGSSIISIMGINQIRRSLDLADIGFQIKDIEKKSSINPNRYKLLELGKREMEKRFSILKLLSEDNV